MGSPNKEWGKFMWASIGSFPAYFVKWNPKKIQLKKMQCGSLCKILREIK